jgi:hypothetical protein
MSPDLNAKARKLRRDGVVLSDLFRKAVEDAYARRKKSKPANHLKILKAIHAGYPKEIDNMPARYNLADRKQARSAILERMQAKAGKQTSRRYK